MMRPTPVYSARPSPRICTSGCGTSTAIFFSRSINATVLWILRSFQKMLPAWSTDSTMFSGFVSRTSLRSFGSSTGIEVVTTGIVIRKMISSTSITSTSGVVLIADTTSSSSAWPTFIAMASRPRCDLRARQQHRVQLGAEAAHLLHHRLVAADERVVAEHRGHRHGKTEGRHDQRFTHRTRDLVNRGLARDADCCPRVIDPPHGAAESHERGRRADG